MTLVIGYGNPLRQDDGIGYEAAARAGGLAVHQLTPELALDVSRAGLVIFIDADRTVAAGEIAEAEVAPAPAGSFTHHVSPAALLALARTLYGRAPRAVLLRAGGAEFGVGDKLTPAGEQAVQRVLERVAEFAAQRG